MRTYWRVYHTCSGIDVKKFASAALAYKFIYLDIIQNEKLPEQYKKLNLHDLENTYNANPEKFFGGRYSAEKVEVNE